MPNIVMSSGVLPAIFCSKSCMSTNSSPRFHLNEVVPSGILPAISDIVFQTPLASCLSYQNWCRENHCLWLPARVSFASFWRADKLENGMPILFKPEGMPGTSFFDMCISLSSLMQWLKCRCIFSIGVILHTAPNAPNIVFMLVLITYTLQVCMSGTIPEAPRIELACLLNRDS